MTKAHLVLTIAAIFVCSPAMATEKARKKGAKAKVEVGASCKVPAAGTCAACSITCRPGESVTCAPGQVMADACHIQPSCKCIR